MSIEALKIDHLRIHIIWLLPRDRSKLPNPVTTNLRIICDSIIFSGNLTFPHLPLLSYPYNPPPFTVLILMNTQGITFVPITRIYIVSTQWMLLNLFSISEKNTTSLLLKIFGTSRSETLSSAFPNHNRLFDTCIPYKLWCWADPHIRGFIILMCSVTKPLLQDNLKRMSRNEKLTLVLLCLMKRWHRYGSLPNMAVKMWLHSKPFLNSFQGGT